MAQKQKKLHIFFEFLAVFIAAPYFIYLSAIIPEPHKTYVFLFAIITLLVDGYLLLTWKRKTKRR